MNYTIKFLCPNTTSVVRSNSSIQNPKNHKFKLTKSTKSQKKKKKKRKKKKLNCRSLRINTIKPKDHKEKKKIQIQFFFLFKKNQEKKSCIENLCF